MVDPALDVTPLWAAVLGAGVFFYVLLDGFDLGVGILYAFAGEPFRRTMMNSIGPFWDGNETWLVLGGVGLFAVFPLAFAIIIPAVYFPILLMLLGLVFRGVAFEYQFKQRAIRRWWERGFAVGSIVATLAQGAVLGAFIQGFEVRGRDFAGSTLDWISPFTVLTALALCAGYALLGAGWLVMKTEGDLQAWARRAGRICLAGVVLAIAVVSLWTPLMDAAIARRWFSWPNIAFLAPVPILTAGVSLLEWRLLRRGPDWGPFVAAMGLFFLAYTGIAVSLWPLIVPPHYTLWQAASAPSTQLFLLVGALFLLPVIIMYTAFSYWVFRGKVREHEGYH